MKKKPYIKIALFALLGTGLLSSCLKDNAHYTDFAGSKPLVELPAAANIAGGGGLLESQAFSISSTPSPFNTLVNLASPKTLSTPLTVKFKIDQAALDSLNKADTTGGTGAAVYTVLPTADYSSTLTVTIPAGQREANLVVNVNTSLIDPTQSYALPLTISDGGGQQISNYKTIIYVIQVKNKYDGVYTVTGSLVDNTTSTITGSYPYTVSLITQGANSVAYADSTGANAGFYHLISTSTGVSEYGSYAPVFTFSGNSVVSVTNLYGQFSGSHVRSAAINPGGINAFTTGTPGTAGSVFKVSYYLEQGNPAALRTVFTETFTYVGSR